ncbi:MAG: polysaccharide biosynthesis tyrosine autokinase [Oscillatoria sp. PMC 1068.18]|nr:polysaccharide biosynthesis tyrosine autokinase [Oscillatoria sp. PMC 1076.18]MEC4987392.1 polysaccharide biosynthesis tyrosine autokinase [Oscillatoria sp. PMC 1068.18]
MIPALLKTFMQPQEHPEDIDLQKYWLILKRHWLPASLLWLAVIAISLYKALSIEDIYQAQGKLRFKKENTTSALITGAGEKIGKLDSLSANNTPLDTEAQVIRSAPVINQTIETLNLTNEEGELLTYENFLEILQVKTIPGTDVLLITYQDEDPEKAELVVNQLMEIYLKNNILVNRTEAAAAREFITEQLPKTEAALEKAEIALRNFKETNNIVNLDTEKEFSVSQVNQLESEIDQANLQLQRITVRIAEIQNKIGLNSQEALRSNSLSESEGVQQALTKLQEVEQELATEQSRFSDLNPTVIKLQEEKVALETLLAQRVRENSGEFSEFRPRGGVDKSNLQTSELQAGLINNLVSAELELRELIKRRESLEELRTVYKQRANEIPKLEQLQQNLQRQVDAANSAYEILLNNLQEVQIAENQNVGNAQIISPAIASESSVSTSKKMVLGIGIVLGGGLYVVTAFLLELIDTSIKTSKELRNLFDYTLLGMIPVSKKKGIFSRVQVESTIPERQVIDEPHSVNSEAYRMLQANLKFLSPDRDLKVIVVTSSVSKEGKSTVSTNLAAAIAQLGSRVLLVDADLHHPAQHHVWELTNDIGLSDLIVDRAEIERAIKPVIPNLDVLPSGVIPPNSLALLESKRMKLLIESFRQDYDFIILDTPPLLLVADALTLSKITDGILLVARPGIIDRVSATAAKELLQKSGQNVLGLVTNNVFVENEPDSYFHYAKSYHEEHNDLQKAQAHKNSQKLLKP